MSFIKTSKFYSECTSRSLQEKWTDEYFCASVIGKAACLICSESIAVLKEYNIVRLYNSKHEGKYKICDGALRRENVAGLDMGVESQKIIFRKQSNDSSSELRENYRVSNLLAEECKKVSCNTKYLSGKKQLLDELKILVVT
jgi:hypothetical protein